MRFRFLLSSLLVFAGCQCGPQTMGTSSEVRLSTSALDFGDVYVGATRTAQVTMTNAGRAPVTVELSAPAPFSLEETSVQLAGGEGREVTVTFAPTAPGAALDQLAVSGLTATVTLSGNGLAVPACPDEPCATSAFSLTEARCVRTPRPDATACDPGCGAAGTCVAGVCLASNSGRCDDGDPCTVDACGSDGGCVTFPKTCPVTGACQVASCDSAVGCIETPVEDGVVCGEPTCAAAQLCLGGTCQTRSKPNAAADCTYVEVSAHGFSACAKSVSGATRCWGANSRDELLRGFGTSAVEPAPLNVGFEVDHFTGGRTLCVVRSDGKLICPQVFDGGDEAFTAIAVRPPCGLLRDGGLFGCTQLSDAGREEVLPATRLHGGEATYHCLSSRDGGLVCFGTAAVGDAGLGYDTWAFGQPPVDVFVRSGLWALMPDGGVEARGRLSGSFSTLPGAHQPWASFAVDSYAQNFAWGLLSDGRVESCAMLLDDAGLRSRPCVPLPGAHSFERLTAGDSFACGLDFTGAAWCWGNNQFGQLGEPTVAQAPRTLSSPDIVATSGSVTCFRDGGCEVATFQAPVPFAAPGPIDDLCGYDLISGGQAWRVDLEGRLTPQPIPPGSHWQPVGGGSSCAFQRPDPDGGLASVSSQADEWRCALRVDGGTDCTGQLNGRFGLLPEDGGIEFVEAQHVAFPAASQLRSSGRGICVLTAAGRVWCWGESLGALQPLEEPLAAVRQLECGNGACCALHGSNGVSCWGQNWANQLGASGPASLRPRAVVVDEPVRRLNYEADCALLTSGRARCWSWAGSEAPSFSETPLRLVK